MRDYAQQHSSAGSESAEPTPAKKAVSVLSASSLFGHYSKEVPSARTITGSALLRQYLTDDTTSTAFDTRYIELRPYFEHIFCIPATSAPVDILSVSFANEIQQKYAPCGLRGCKNWPAPFPGRMLYKTTKPGLALSVVYLSMFYCNVVY